MQEKILKLRASMDNLIKDFIKENNLSPSNINCNLNINLLDTYSIDIAINEDF